MYIYAKWDRKFGKREPGTKAIFLMAGKETLGYITKHRSCYLACIGAGISAPWVASGSDLKECKNAIERRYGIAKKLSGHK